MRRRKRTREGAARRRCSISRLLFPFSLPHFLAVLSRSPFSSTLQKRRRRRRRQKDGTTPLHLAAIRGNAPAVAALLAAPGVSVSCSSPAHPHSLRTPLHEAAASGSAECARLLLKAGADPRAQDARGKTPASVALDAGNSKLAVELAEGIRGSTGAGWWSSAVAAAAARPSRDSREKATSYPTLHGTSPVAVAAPRDSSAAAAAEKAARLALEEAWGGKGPAPVAQRPRTAAAAAAAAAAFGGWASAALAPPPPPAASRVAAALVALSATATDAASGVAAAARAAAASAASAAAAAAGAAAGAAAAAAASASASRRAAAAARAEESVEGVPTAPMGAVKSVYEVDAQLRTTFAEKEKEKEEQGAGASPAVAGVAAPLPAAAAAAAAAAPAPSSLPDPPSRSSLLPSLDFGTLAVATRGFGEASKLGGSVRGVTFAGSLPDGTRVAVKVLDPASAPPGAALAGLLLKAVGGGGSLEGEGKDVPSSSGVLDRPLAVGPTSRAIVSRLAEGGSLDGALRGAPLAAASGEEQGEKGAREPPPPPPPPRLPWADRLDLLSQVAAVLSRELHSKGLAHGSVRATNVLLDPVPAGSGAGRDGQRRWRARLGDAGVAQLLSTPDEEGSFSAARDAAALGTMVLQALCGAEGEGLAASVAGLAEAEGARFSASSLAEKGLMEIGGGESSKERLTKKRDEEGRNGVAVVPGASRAVSLALDCVSGKVSAADAARALSELAEGVRSGELLKEEAAAEAAKTNAAAASAAPVAEQPEQSPSAPFLDDYEDVAGELSALEAELAALPSAPVGTGRATEKDKVLAEAV